MLTVNTATVSLDEYIKLKEFFDNVTENKIPVYFDGGWTSLYNRMNYVTKDEAISEIAKVNTILKNENSKLKQTIDTLKLENEKLKAKPKKGWFSFLKFKRY